MNRNEQRVLEYKLHLEAYLKEIGGLINNHTESVIFSTDFFEVGDGWLDLIRECIENLIRLGWDKRVSQVKEKFGGLRFYASESASSDMIANFERTSYHTCEECGMLGYHGKRPGSNWLRTLCKEHGGIEIEPMNMNVLTRKE